MELLKTVFYCASGLLIIICVSVSSENVKGPGLSFQPMPPAIEGKENSLIWYKARDLESTQPLVNKLNDFLADYQTPTSTSGRLKNTYDCGYHQPPPKGQACMVDIRAFQPCSAENKFNYYKSTPCIFLKIENTEGWIPEYYNDTKSLPENMPAYLKNKISNAERTNQEELNTVWVSCEGANPVDNEFIGPIDYMPMQGFPGYFFQHEKPANFLSPLVALRFAHPTRGVVIFLECKLWARNIVHDANAKVGLVQFELLVD